LVSRVHAFFSSSFQDASEEKKRTEKETKLSARGYLLRALFVDEEQVFFFFYSFD